MRKCLLSILIILGFLAPTSRGNNEQTISFCTHNKVYLQHMIDKGVIKDSSYYSIAEQLKSENDHALSKLSAQRRNLNVNADKLKARMNQIAQKIILNDITCLPETVALRKNLLEYSKSARPDKGDDYYLKFLPSQSIYYKFWSKPL